MSVFRLKKKPTPEAIPIETLFEELEGALLAHAYRITAQREAAQDIVQDAFIKLHQSETPIHAPRPWLYRTVHNLAINLSKRAAREKPLETAEAERTDQENTQLPPPSKSLEHSEILTLTHLFIDQLDDRSRAVVQLKFIDGQSYAQIAAQLDLTVSNVGYLLHQAVATLASEFEKMGLRK